MKICLWMPRVDRGFFLAEHLSDMSLNVTICHHKNVNKSVKFEFRKVSKNPIISLFQLFFIKSDIYCTSRSYIPVLQLAFAKLMLKNRKYTYTLNSPLWTYNDERAGNNFKKSLLDSAFLFSIKMADRIFFNSNHVLSLFTKSFPIYTEKAATIYNGIDFRKFQLCARTTEKKIFFVCIGTINYSSKLDGIKFILDAYCFFSERINSKLVMLLKCDSNSQAEDFNRYLSNHPYKNNIDVHFNHPNVLTYLIDGAISIYATPPDSTDSLPRVLLESLACGVPTVTVNTSGCAEPFFSLGYVKTTLDSYDYISFAEMMMKVWKSYDEYSEEFVQLSSQLRDKFSWASMAASYAVNYIEISQNVASSKDY